MVFPGGSAAKKGDYYEQIWTTRCILQVLRGEFETITLEPLGQSEDGFEFVISGPRMREYHQVKRQHSEGNWTLSRLHQKKILQNFWQKLQDPNVTCWFVSTTDAQSLRELTERSKQLQHWNYFQQQALASSSRGDDFEELLRYLNLEENDKPRLFDALKRIEIRIGDEKTLAEANGVAIERWFGVDEIAARTIGDVLSQLRNQQLHRELSANDILAYLKHQGISTIPQSKEQLNLHEVERYLKLIIQNLEKPIGVLQYVELKTFANAASVSKPPLNWGPEFSLIENKQQNSTDSQAEEKIPFKDINEALSKFDKFVLVGAPGAGKTTTLKRMTLKAAKDCLANLDRVQDFPIPFMVSLPAWRNDNRGIADFVRAQFYNWDFGLDVIDLLNRKLAILFMDGLNEMGVSGSTKAVQIRRWINGEDDRGQESIAILQPHKLIATCRRDDYLSYNLGIPIVQTEELDHQRIVEFANNYLGDRASQFIARILPEGRPASPLLSLARNPYRLAILILLYQQSPSGQLPQNTGRLFQQMVQQLWLTEQERRPNLNIDYNTMLNLLSRFAFAMVDAEMPTSVSHAYASLYIDNTSVLDAANEVLLIVEGNEVSFYHQSMQEYFAAVSLQRVGLEHITLSHSKPVEEFDQIFFQGIYGGEFVLSDKWNQVVIALCGIVDDPLVLIHEIAQVNPFLAQLCINSGIEVAEIDLVPSYLAALNSQNINVVGTAIQALGLSGDERVITSLIRFLDHPNKGIQSATITALIQLGLIGIEELLGELVQGTNETKSVIATILIGMGSKVIAFIVDLIPRVDQLTQQYICMILGKVGNSEVIDVLVQAFATSEDVDIRKQSVLALGEIGGDKAINRIAETLRDKSSQVRQTAIKTLTLIKGEGIRTAIEILVRHTAVENNPQLQLELATFFGEQKDPSTINALNKLFLERQWSVHKTAYDALVNIGTSKCLQITRPFRLLRSNMYDKWESGTRGIYEKFGVIGFVFALKHSYKNARTYWDIARHINQLPDDDMPLLIEQLSDKNSLVRNKIAYALGERGNPEYATYLMPLLSDSEAFVRGEAVQALGKLKYVPAIGMLRFLIGDTVTVYTNHSKRVSDYAIAALQQIGTDEALAALKKE